MRDQRSNQDLSNHRRAALSGVSTGAIGTAIAGAALCAGLFALLPQAWSDPASPDTAPSAAVSTNQQAQPASCTQQAWPYIDQSCGTSADAGGKTRRVRVLSTDHGAPSIINTPMPTIAAKTQPAVTAHADAAPAQKPAHTATNLVNYRQLPFQTAMQTETKAAVPAANPTELSHAQRPQEQASSNAKPDAVAETKTAARPETRKPVRTAARHTAPEHKSAATRQASAQRNGEGLLVVHTVDYADGRRVTTYGSLNGRSDDVAVARRPEFQRGFYVSSNDEDEDF